jgi:hypothetical protein
MNNEEAIKELKEIRELLRKTYIQYHSGCSAYLTTSAEKIDKVIEFLNSQNNQF